MEWLWTRTGFSDDDFDRFVGTDEISDDEDGSTNDTPVGDTTKPRLLAWLFGKKPERQNHDAAYEKIPEPSTLPLGEGIHATRNSLVGFLDRAGSLKCPLTD